MHLIVDSREPYWIREKFKTMGEAYNDLTVTVESLRTGDYITDYFVIERKTVDDFISSFTQPKTRKDGTRYHRLHEQCKRMLNMDQPLKIFLVIGDLSSSRSLVSEHSFNGQLAKLSALGFSVIFLKKTDNWFDYIYRLCRMCEKYTKIGVPMTLKNEGEDTNVEVNV